MCFSSLYKKKWDFDCYERIIKCVLFNILILQKCLFMWKTKRQYAYNSKRYRVKYKVTRSQAGNNINFYETFTK